tara:strand:- start:40 stop:315 length:276 start_codon:yes stop_codon:yes gene_type:complete
VSLGKKDISKNISTKAHFSLNESENFLNSFLKLLKDKGRKNIIKISKFGTFEKKITPQRIGRNPKTKEEFIINKRSKFTFKSSNNVKSFLN